MPAHEPILMATLAGESSTTAKWKLDFWPFHVELNRCVQYTAFFLVVVDRNECYTNSTIIHTYTLKIILHRGNAQFQWLTFDFLFSFLSKHTNAHRIMLIVVDKEENDDDDDEEMYVSGE